MGRRRVLGTARAGDDVVEGGGAVAEQIGPEPLQRADAGGEAGARPLDRPALANQAPSASP